VKALFDTNARDRAPDLPYSDRKASYQNVEPPNGGLFSQMISILLNLALITSAHSLRFY